MFPGKLLQLLHHCSVPKVLFALQESSSMIYQGLTPYGRCRAALKRGGVGGKLGQYLVGVIFRNQVRVWRWDFLTVLERMFDIHVPGVSVQCRLDWLPSSPNLLLCHLFPSAHKACLLLYFITSVFPLLV